MPDEKDKALSELLAILHELDQTALTEKVNWGKVIPRRDWGKIMRRVEKLRGNA